MVQIKSLILAVVADCHVLLIAKLQECLKSKFKKIPNFILQGIVKQTVPCKSTAKEVSLEWSHHRILSADSKVRITLHVSIIDSGSEMINITSESFFSGTEKEFTIKELTPGTQYMFR